MTAVLVAVGAVVGAVALDAVLRLPGRFERWHREWVQTRRRRRMVVVAEHRPATVAELEVRRRRGGAA